MPILTVASVLQAVLTYGPTVVGVLQKLVADIEAGKANQAVTAADLAELQRLGTLSAADLFAQAGVSLPGLKNGQQ